MIQLYVMFIMLLLYMVITKVVKKFITPYSYKQLKKVNEAKAYTSDIDVSFEQLQSNASRNLPIINMNKDAEDELDKKIKRLGLETTAKELRRLQLLYFISTLAIAVFTKLIFGNAFAIVVALGSVYAWNLPVIHINNQIRDRDMAILIELPEMYSVLYYAYRRSSSINLTSKIQSYIKDSSDLYYKEMMLFIEDSKNGEIEALKEFSKRVPLSVVNRFCNIMASRLDGNDNVSVMELFKKEMDSKREQREDQLLKDLQNKLTTISWIGIMIPMAIILIIYFAAQMMSAFVS